MVGSLALFAGLRRDGTWLCWCGGFAAGLPAVAARKLQPRHDERGRARRLGITDLDRKYKLLDLASGDVMFAATGVTNGTMLRGVRRFAGGATTHSVVMRSKSGTVRYVEARHDFTRSRASPHLRGDRRIRDSHRSTRLRHFRGSESPGATST